MTLLCLLPPWIFEKISGSLKISLNISFCQLVLYRLLYNTYQHIYMYDADFDADWDKLGLYPSLLYDRDSKKMYFVVSKFHGGWGILLPAYQIHRTE